jgi:hypothetical protein
MTRSTRTSTHKRCSKCGIWKPFSEFQKDNREDHIVRSSCKQCMQVSSRIHFCFKFLNTPLKIRNEKAKINKKVKIVETKVWKNSHEARIWDGRIYSCFKFLNTSVKYQLILGGDVFFPQKLKNETCCTILKVHAELLKGDPERLTTDFIKNLSKCGCEEDVR